MAALSVAMLSCTFARDPRRLRFAANRANMAANQ
jgi:hypothetical protein